MRGTCISQIAQTLGLAHPSSSVPIHAYQVDSRLIGPSDLFFALPGERTDGHQYLQASRSRGAIAAVVSRAYSGPDFGLLLLPVDDVQAALQHLARTAAAASSATVIAVTGSVGKTTTKEFIATLLGAKYRVGKNIASYNTQLTLPTTILNMQGDETVWVLEMGMSEPGDIGKLVDIAPPDIALLTKVGLAHTEAFPGGLPEIIRGKAEVFRHSRTRLAIFPHLLSDSLTHLTIPKLSFSLEDKSADYFFSEGVLDERGVRAYRFESPFKEKHLQYNLLAALSVARALHMSWEEIEPRIPLIQLPKMRFERFEQSGIVFINDAYNANPESMKAALSNLPDPKPGGKRIAVLGAMHPFGNFSVEVHQDVGRFASLHVDHLLTYGQEALPLWEVFADGKKPAEHFSDQRLLAQRLKEIALPGDVVLVKGSRVMQMETIFEYLEAHAPTPV